MDDKVAAMKAGNLARAVKYEPATVGGNATQCFHTAQTFHKI